MIHLGFTDIDMHVPHKETKPMNKKMQNNDTKNTLKVLMFTKDKNVIKRQSIRQKKQKNPL